MTNQKQTVKFGDICREVKLSSKDPLADGYDKYIGLEHLDSGSLKIKRWGSIVEDNPSFTRIFKKGHILFGKRRPYLKKAAIAEFDGICSGDIIVMEPKGDLMLPELLPFIVQSEKFWGCAVMTSSGSLSPRTRFKDLVNFEVRGLTKEEQLCAYKLLTIAENNIVNASLFSDSSLIAFQRAVDFYLTNDRDKVIKAGWKRIRLKHLVKINEKSLTSKTPPGKEINYIDISTVSFPGVVGESQRLKYSDAPSRARRVVETGDVVISTVRPNHRASFYVKNELSGSIVSTGFSVLTPKTIDCGRWIYFLTLSKQTTYSLTNLAVGTSYPAVSEGDILSQYIDVPSDVEMKIISV